MNLIKHGNENIIKEYMALFKKLYNLGSMDNY